MDHRVWKSRVARDLVAERAQHDLGEVVAVDAPHERRQRRGFGLHDPIVTAHNKFGPSHLVYGPPRCHCESRPPARLRALLYLRRSSALPSLCRGRLLRGSIAGRWRGCVVGLCPHRIAASLSRHGQPDGAARRARGRRHDPSAEAQRRQRRAVRRRPPLSAKRLITFGHATRARRVLTLRSAGVERLRKCSTTKLEVRMTVRRGSHTLTVTDRRMLRSIPAAARPRLRRSRRSRSRRCPRRTPPTTRVRRPRRLPPSPRRLPPSPRRRRTRPCSRSAPRSSTSRPTRRWPSAATAPTTS